MKKASLKGLIFREIYGNRKGYVTGLILFFGISVFMILVQLSMQIGNLAMIPELANDFKNDVTLMMIYMPVMMAGLLGSAEKATERDCKKGWMRFMYTTPVSEFRFSLVRYLCILVGTLVGYLFGLLHTAVICGMSGTSFDYEMLSVITALVIVTLLFNVILTVMIQLLGTIEKAALSIIGVLMGGMLIYITTSDKKASDVMAEKMVELSETLLPFMPLIFIAILALSCGLSTLVLKRREK